MAFGRRQYFAEGLSGRLNPAAAGQRPSHRRARKSRDLVVLLGERKPSFATGGRYRPRPRRRGRRL
ncbi:hypothetical protein MPLB_1700059 [Mesorhizobium sp. ORS 3324]|nr:hypothetical protein MPLB_1700059 [Mesorhizobium sp. ORS 3324]